MNASNMISAVNAYNNQLKLQSGEAESSDSSGGTGVLTFSELVKNGLQEAVDVQYNTEAVKMEALTGKVDLSDLVTAISSAELTLNTVVAVRDRVISAYQDIIRMPI